MAASLTKQLQLFGSAQVIVALRDEVAEAADETRRVRGPLVRRSITTAMDPQRSVALGASSQPESSLESGLGRLASYFVAPPVEVSGAEPRVVRGEARATEALTSPGGLEGDVEEGDVEESDVPARLFARRGGGTRRPARLTEEPPRPVVTFYPELGVALGYVDRAGLAGLRAERRVEEVSPAPLLSLVRPQREARPPASRDKIAWSLQRMRVPELWKRGLTGRGILIAHLDTGVDASHPMLDGALRSFIRTTRAGRVLPSARPADSAEHGTHTAGIIAGRTANGLTCGVAPGAELASAQVIEGGEVIARVLSGLNWAIGEKARILSLSLGLRGFDEGFAIIVKALRRRGILPVVAVGNEGPNTSRSPGNYANVLSVGAMGRDDSVWFDSSSQRFARSAARIVPDLVAPGVAIVSCVPGGKYAAMSGTSMATPHVAGLAALLLEGKPDATILQLERAIAASCERPATMTANRANRGVPDAVRALEELP